MGEVIPKIPVQWTVLASACLHAGVALLFVFKIVQAPVNLPVVPLGVEMLYLGEAQSAAPAVRPVVPPRTKVSTPKLSVPAVSVPVAKNEPAPQIDAAPADAAPASEAQTAASAGPAGARDGAIVSALERYKFELRMFLESRKIYPETAKRLRQTGRVVVNFKVSAVGELTDVMLEQASPSEVLNRAAVDLVRSAPKFKPFPEGAISQNEMKLSLPIEYIL